MLKLRFILPPAKMILILDFKLTSNLYTPWVASKINDTSSLARKYSQSLQMIFTEKNDFIIGRHMIVNRILFFRINDRICNNTIDLIKHYYSGRLLLFIFFCFSLSIVLKIQQFTVRKHNDPTYIPYEFILQFLQLVTKYRIAACLYSV